MGLLSNSRQAALHSARYGTECGKGSDGCSCKVRRAVGGCSRCCIWWRRLPAAARSVLELDVARAASRCSTAATPGSTMADTGGRRTGAATVATDPPAWHHARRRDLPAWTPRKAPVDPLHRAAGARPRALVPRSALPVGQPGHALHARTAPAQWVGAGRGRHHCRWPSWPVPHRHPLLPILVSAEEPRTYLVRIENPHSFSAPLTFVSESYLAAASSAPRSSWASISAWSRWPRWWLALSAVSLRDTALRLVCDLAVTMGLARPPLTGIAGLHLVARLAVVERPVVAWCCRCSAMAAMQVFFVRRRVAAGAVAHPSRCWPGAGRARAVAALAIMLVEPSYRFRMMVPYIVRCTVAGAGRDVVGREARRPLCAVAAARHACRWPSARRSRSPRRRPHPGQLLDAVRHADRASRSSCPCCWSILMLRSQHRREHVRRIQGLDRIDPATGLINAACSASGWCG